MSSAMLYITLQKVSFQFDKELILTTTVYRAWPTTYANVRFRSRLEARWAAFFDLIKLKWEYEPLDLTGWVPDFRVTVPCYHSGCENKDGSDGAHIFLCEVKPYHDVAQFKGHPCTRYTFYGGDGVVGDDTFPADASVGIGASYDVSTRFDICHGSGGGEYSFVSWIEYYVADMVSSACDVYLKTAWAKAGNEVQWKPR